LIEADDNEEVKSMSFEKSIDEESASDGNDDAIAIRS